MKPNVLTFFQESLQRLFTKSPKFFKIWMFFSGALVLITGVPDFINMLNINGVSIPDLWNAKVTLAVGWASRAVFFMSLLTTQSTPVGVTPTGKVLKQTDARKLPFTAAVEENTAEKHGVAPIVIAPARAGQVFEK